MPLQPATGPNRACWDCRQKRWICDLRRPGCLKCEKTGGECGGYGAKKPVRWLKPGQVISRKGEFEVKQSAEAKGRAGDDMMMVGKTLMRRRTVEMRFLNQFQANGRELRSELCDVGEATYYYNETILPFEFSGQFEPNPSAQKVFPKYFTESAQYLMVVNMLRHRAAQTPALLKPGSPAHTRMIDYNHKAIKSLSRSIDSERTRYDDETFFSMWYFIIVESLSSTNPIWKPHRKAMLKVIELRGGFDKFVASATYMKPSIFLYLSFEIICATTIHSTEIASVFSQPETIAWLRNVDDGHVLAPLPLPLSLTINLVEINALRREYPSDEEKTCELFQEQAADLLLRIKDFPRAQWLAARDAYRKEWDILIDIHCSSIFLYAVASLTTLSGQPLTPWSDAFRSTQRTILVAALEKALRIPVLKFVLLWPAMVAGFEACFQGKAERDHIDTYLSSLYDKTYLTSPLVGQEALRQFWASGNKTWDECFAEGYVLTT